MAPPWVTFDSVAAYNGDCASGAEPDIAGLGVVLSFIIASVMTTIASIIAMVLDQAFDSKGRFTLHAPIKYIRERFLDTEWKRDYAGWIKVAQNSFTVQGAHFVLILYICALSSSSHLAALITLRKYFRKYKLIAKIRLTLVIVFALFLLSSMIAAICMPPTIVEHSDGVTEKRSRAQRLSFLVPLGLILVGFSTALVCILYDPKRKGTASRASDSPSESVRGLVRRVTDPKSRPPLDIKLPAHFGLRLLYYLFLNPLIAFVMQILLAILSAILVLSQKFAAPKDAKKFCGLQDEGENVWGFGQTLSVVMLLLPAMSACQTYLEGRQDISEGFTRAKD
ncbi:hypothetical protein EK21DRAFT_109874 [Setomelanomma holmii]|uniref:Uncharacterized protein n=1 Tax=Setomelanomma holmii TaxID=210430 RepID=A0A9P4HF86_9PLEO|nr:hypothetical protein EK21DRAFT_109874 [Setomelanomma holmii]